MAKTPKRTAECLLSGYVLLTRWSLRRGSETPKSKPDGALMALPANSEAEGSYATRPSFVTNLTQNEWLAASMGTCTHERQAAMTASLPRMMSRTWEQSAFTSYVRELPQRYAAVNVRFDMSFAESRPSARGPLRTFEAVVEDSTWSRKRPAGASGVIF